MTFRPPRTTSVTTATTEVVIWLKSMNAFRREERRGAVVSRISRILKQVQAWIALPMHSVNHELRSRQHPGQDVEEAAR